MNGESDFLTKKYKIPFAQVLKLSEAGLISDNGQIQISFEVEPGTTELIRGVNGAIEIINLTNDQLVEICHSVYLLTEAGKELFPIIVENNCTEETYKYMDDCLEELKMHGIKLIGKQTGTPRISIKIIKY